MNIRKTNTQIDHKVKDRHILDVKTSKPFNPPIPSKTDIKVNQRVSEEAVQNK